MDKKRAEQTRYPSKLKERAVRMVFDLQRSDPQDRNVISRVARDNSVWGVNLCAPGSSKRKSTPAVVLVSRPISRSELTKLRKESRELCRVYTHSAFIRNFFHSTNTTAPGPEHWCGVSSRTDTYLLQNAVDCIISRPASTKG